MRLLRRERRFRAEQEDPDPLGDEGVDRVRAILFLGGVPGDALDDGVQQVRLKLLERQSRQDAALSHPKAWLGVVASNVAADWHRSHRRDRGLAERLAARRAQTTVDPQEHTTLATAIAAGLDELPEQQRQLLILRFYDDLSVRDIAQTLGIAEGTVKSRLHNAVKAIRNRLRALEVI